MSMTRSTTQTIAACIAVLLLAGCSGIGSGSKPEKIQILQLDPRVPLAADPLTRPTEPAKVFTCIRSALGGFVTFSDGSVGNFTSRALWTSSDPGVVRVSNADEPVPFNPGLVFGFGALTPVAAGSATVTVNYLGLTATIPVIVQALDTSTLTITPAKATMVPNSVQAFRAEATLDGVVRDVSDVVNFRFTTPDDNVATVDRRGTVVAQAPGAQLNLEANFNSPCTVTPVAPVQVAMPTALRLERETDFYPSGTSSSENRVVRGYTQFARVIAEFGADFDADGSNDEQDLGSQIGRLVLTATTTDPAPAPDTTAPTIVAFGSSLGRSNQVTGVTVGAADVTARYGPISKGVDGISGNADDEFLDSSAPLSFKVVDGPSTTVDGITTVTNPLQGFSIAPSDPGITTVLGEQQFRATGSFVVDDSVTSLVHDITRHVQWTASKAIPADAADARTVAFIGNFPGTLSAGLATSLLKAGEDPAQSAIQATAVAGEPDATATDPASDPDDVQTTTLSLSAPAAP